MNPETHEADYEAGRLLEEARELLIRAMRELDREGRRKPHATVAMAIDTIDYARRYIVEAMDEELPPTLTVVGGAA
jgi:hypothetical protein